MITDYGTNAEMGLYYDGELYSGSAAAGPAMEGQAVECGMLAAPFALSDVNLDTDGMWTNTVLDEKLAPTVAARVDPLTGRTERLMPIKAIGITGTGVVSAMAIGMESGVIKLPNICSPSKLIHFMDGMTFNEHDAIEAGKAMGAIRAGHRTLIHEVGIKDEEVKTMYMAGASGTYVDALKAQTCGMIPRSLDSVYQLGNTSLMMAHDLLRDSETLDHMQSVADSISANHIMFATSPTFEAMYVLEIAYWLEGMSLQMYNEMIQMSGIAPLPPIRVPSKVVRMKTDIPEIGERGLKVLKEVGVRLVGAFEGCIGCRKCETECPERAIVITDLEDDEYLIRVATDRCLGTACYHCEMTCPEKVFVFNELIVEKKH